MTMRGDGVLYGMSKIALDRFTQGWAREVFQYRVAVNSLSPRNRIRTPGNSFVGNNREAPTLEFDSPDPMGKAAVWICEQDPAQYTGNLAFDLDVPRRRGCSRRRSGRMPPPPAYRRRWRSL
jgi:NAD(P)-dependent dehydrogenase (short-subunit alcohol dehydrogenase family)